MKKALSIFFGAILCTSGIAQPTLYNPSKGAVDTEAGFSISISSVSGALTYDIEVSDDGSFTGVHPDYQAQLTSTSRSYLVTELDYGGTYSLRWRADNTGYDQTTFTVKSSPITYASNITNGQTLPSSYAIVPQHQYLVSDYDWEFDTAPTFDTPNLISANTLSSASAGRYSYVQTNFLSNTQYYVRVRGNVSSQSLTGDWSVDVRNFFTGSTGAPALYNPSQNATDTEAGFTVSIGSVSGAASYDIEVSDDGSYTGVHPDYQSQLASTSRSMSVSELNYGGTYNLRWRADNSSYGTTTFTVKSSPITYASNITNGETLPSTYSITPQYQYLVDNYDWEFDTEATFDSPNLISANTSASTNSGAYSYNQNNFISGELYYVRVRGNVTSQSLTGDWSTDVRNFNVALKAAPSLFSPAAEATDMPLSFTISIGSVSGAASYDIEISKNGLFTDSNPDYQGQVGVFSRSFSVSNLSTNTVYTLRWRADNSEYGTTTITTLNDVTTYHTLPNGTYLNTQITSLNQVGVSGATGYTWEFDTVNTFDSPAFMSSTISASSNSGRYPYVATDFLSGELYYCRISVQGVGSGSYGAITNFYASLHAPLIVYPANLQTINRVALKLKCANAENATQHQIQYATSSDFLVPTTLVTNYDWYVPGGWNNPGGGGELTQRAYNYVSGLNYGTTYYVRATSSNANQAGNWGTTYQFNTGNPQVEITNPADGAAGINTTITVTCNLFYGVATLYEFDVDDDPGFGSPITNSATNNGFRFVGLDAGTVYYTRARIFHNGQWWPYSPVTSFTTIVAAKEGDQDVEISESAVIQIYPNPSNSSFNLFTSDVDDVNVTVLDLAGKQVAEFVQGEGAVAFGENLSPGMYFVSVQFSDGSIETKRIVKQ